MRYRKQQSGFTLMEIMVASLLFVIISVSLLSLFNYVLKINRRSEALRQSAQGMRNFMEFLVKEIRNGQIDYNVANGQTYTGQVNSNANSPCKAPQAAGNPVSGEDTYYARENKLGIINTDNVQQCFYFGKNDGSYVDVVGSPPSTFSAPDGSSYTLVLEKDGVSQPQILNPSNLRVENLMFLIRPLCDPYTIVPPGCDSYGDDLPKIQPVVAIAIKFVVQLPTLEQVPIYYQTSVTSNKYDIPNQ